MLQGYRLYTGYIYTLLNILDPRNGYNYLQLLYREVKGVLLYQGFPRPMREGCFVDKIGRGNPWLISRKSSCTKILSSFEMKMRYFSPVNFAELVVILLNCPKGH